MNGGVSMADPFVLDNAVFPAVTLPDVPGPYRKTAGLAIRSAVINPSLKTLVLFVAGQSLTTNITPTLYTPTNSSVIDQLNIYDGALYEINGPMLGTSTLTASPYGPGNLCARLADLFIPTFDRVIVASIAVGGTTIADWATGSLSNRIGVTIGRLAARGITSATPGVTMALAFALGEQDYINGTIQSAWTSGFTTTLANATAAGFSGRAFVNRETTPGDTTSGTYLAQAALPNGSTIFAGGNWNLIANRVDGAHFNDTGAAAGALSLFNAMHATGAPL